MATASLTPLILDDEVGDEVLGFIGHALKGLLIKVPVGSQNVVECLGVIVTQEGGEATEPGGERGEESGALRLQHLPDPPEQSQSGQGCSRDVLPPSCLQPG